MARSLGDAEEYALFGHPGTEARDCDFLQAVFRAAGAPVKAVLDIACGTGRHATEMSRRGYRVTGIDASEDMLAAAARAVQAAGVTVALLHRDMRQLQFERPFDAAYCLFNTMALLVDNHDLLAFLAAVRAALRPGGLLVVQVGNPWPVIAEGKLANSTYTSEEERGGVRRQRRFEMTIGPLDNVMRRVDCRRFWRNGVELEPKTEESSVRIFSLNELDLACRLTGFTVRQVYGATDVTAAIADARFITPVAEASQSYVLALER